MSKKITKDEFTTIMAKAVSEEMHEFETKMGSSSLAIALLGASIGSKIKDLLFENEEVIEIITDKE